MSIPTQIVHLQRSLVSIRENIAATNPNHPDYTRLLNLERSTVAQLQHVETQLAARQSSWLHDDGDNDDYGMTDTHTTTTSSIPSITRVAVDQLGAQGLLSQRVAEEIQLDLPAYYRADRDEPVKKTLLGSLWLATDTLNARPVAIKRSSCAELLSGRHLDNPAKEVDVALFLQQQQGGHPNLCRVYEVWLEPSNGGRDASFCAAQEFCGGGQLFEFITNVTRMGRLTEDDRRVWFYQIADAMDFMHRHHVYHGDVTAENVLLFHGPGNTAATAKLDTLVTKSIQLKIIDFGLAEFESNPNAVQPGGKYGGKVGYMSPEKFLRQTWKRFEDDVYSLGIILFMLCTGAAPYGQSRETGGPTSASFHLIYDGHLQELLVRWKLAKKVHPDAADLMQKILAPPSKRYTLQQIFAHPWLAKVVAAHRKGNSPQKPTGSSGAASSSSSSSSSSAAAAPDEKMQDVVEYPTAAPYSQSAQSGQPSGAPSSSTHVDPQQQAEAAAQAQYELTSLQEQWNALLNYRDELTQHIASAFQQLSSSQLSADDRARVQEQVRQLRARREQRESQLANVQQQLLSRLTTEKSSWSATASQYSRELALWAQSGSSVQDPQYITLQQELAVVLQRVEQIDDAMQRLQQLQVGL